MIPTCQQSGVDLVGRGQRVEDEKDRLLERVRHRREMAGLVCWVLCGMSWCMRLRLTHFYSSFLTVSADRQGAARPTPARKLPRSAQASHILNHRCTHVHTHTHSSVVYQYAKEVVSHPASCRHLNPRHSPSRPLVQLQFVEFAKEVVARLQAAGHWADYIDPCRCMACGVACGMGGKDSIASCGGRGAVLEQHAFTIV